MAKTYTYGDVLSLIASQIPKGTEDDKAAFICNLALNRIWKRYDWPESLAPLPPFSLTPGEQDHGAPAVAVPSDFGGLRKADFVQVSVPATRRELLIVRNLGETSYQGLPETICWEPSVSAFRVYPRVPENITAPLYQIDGIYKIRATKLTASTIHSTLLPFDDTYLNVFVEMAKWAAWSLTSDQKAGATVVANGQESHTGQLATAMSAVKEMASDAGLILGDAVVTPQMNTWYDNW